MMIGGWPGLVRWYHDEFTESFLGLSAVLLLC